MTQVVSTSKIVSAHEFIIVYQCLELDMCKKIIDKFEISDHKTEGKVAHSDGNIRISEDKITHDLWIAELDEWKAEYSVIDQAIEPCIRDYGSRSPILQAVNVGLNEYKVIRYEKGKGVFQWHADATGAKALARQVAIVLYLNDVPLGGETEFFHQGIKIKPAAGQLLLFPVCWTYMHRGLMPESNHKYIVTSFLELMHLG